jgi:hypothetical protein
MVATLDVTGRVLASTEVMDDNGKICPALIRFTPDRLFDGVFDGAAGLVCPN